MVVWSLVMVDSSDEYYELKFQFYKTILMTAPAVTMAALTLRSS